MYARWRWADANVGSASMAESRDLRASDELPFASSRIPLRNFVRALSLVVADAGISAIVIAGWSFGPAAVALCTPVARLVSLARLVAAMPTPAPTRTRVASPSTHREEGRETLGRLGGGLSSCVAASASA